jgi:outer membrane lipoprotein-sorting protein
MLTIASVAKAGFLVLIPTLGTCFAQDAREILTKTAENYRNLKSAQFDGNTITVTRMGGGAAMTSDLGFQVAFADPNKVRVEFRYPNAGNWIRVCDGTTLYGYRSITGDLKKEPAGAEVLGLVRTTPISDYQGLDQGVTEAKLIGSEKLAIGGTEVDTYVLEIKRDGNSLIKGLERAPSKLWIDKDRHVVLKEVTTTRSGEGSTATENEKTTTFTIIKVNEDIPGKLFAFEASQ